MRLPEFIINLFTRYAPVEKTTLANLQIEISSIYMKNLNKLEQKIADNAELESKLTGLEEEMKDLDPHTPEYERKLFEFEKIEREIQEPSVFEKVVSFLEKPVVRLILLVSFVFVSRWISKKLTETKDEKERDQEEHEEHAQPHYYQPPPYQPYGYGFMPPQPYQHPANKPNQRY